MKLYVVGFGAGSHGGITFDAEKAILSSDIIVGYTAYTEILEKIYPEKIYYSTAMKQEKERVSYAVQQACGNKIVSIVCSGDSGVYGMACLALEMSCGLDIDIEIVPGITAALSGAALLGAPLTHDFAVISLSDLLTPIEKIRKRIECAAMADFSIVLYNPSSKKRADYLKNACNIMLKYKSSDTVCGIVRNIGREGEDSRILSLNELKDFKADMFTTVFIGNSETKIINDRMVTPRGYKNV